ncbi:signal recognition particle-docking protein FtsY [Treponema primitia]|uniref:signal recognition particle-docking protein FtsY n=1 Tax=Treponema primitia TaxID=88058 RepID=UPI0002554E75|nr:signal recognition particle-docking protein FtsY [Treponema primitia]
MGAASFADRLKNFFGRGKQVSEELFEDLADLLVEGDFGAAEAFKTVDALRLICKKEGISDPTQARMALASLLERSLCISPVGAQNSLVVILLLGVNGVGKTTTAAKLAERYRSLDKKKPILAAADTFRAAAVDQLKIHGERLGVRVVAHKQGGDPAAVVYDALEAALAGGGDMIIADTAGRMHTKTALVEELKKIDRVVESKAPGAKYIRWLVLDSTTGRNALAQAETFHQAVALDGVILTKFDSSAKGGVVYSLSTELRLPVVFLCNGEQYGDIKPFDPKEYTKEFIGLD